VVKYGNVEKYGNSLGAGCMTTRCGKYFDLREKNSKRMEKITYCEAS
jgi:hypothetical protein